MRVTNRCALSIRSTSPLTVRRGPPDCKAAQRNRGGAPAACAEKRLDFVAAAQCARRPSGDRLAPLDVGREDRDDPLHLTAQQRLVGGQEMHG